MKIDSYQRYITAPGNAGDSAIALATLPILKAANHTPDDPAAPIIFKGGGMGHWWNETSAPLRGWHQDTPIIILPCSLDGESARKLKQLGYTNLKIYVRGAVSLRIARENGLNAELHEDLAFSLDLSEWGGITVADTLYAMRADRESGTNWRPGNRKVTDISMAKVTTFNPFSEETRLTAAQFIATIDKYRKVITDRLHVAIIAAKLGKKVELIGGIDHKIWEVWDFSMREQYPNVKFINPWDISRGIAPEAVVIHRTASRHRYPKKLLELVGNARILEAICPDWDASDTNNSIRGCSLSHLAATQMDHLTRMPMLVLEDDAEVVPENYEKWLRLDDFPDDCGAILLGGDIKSAIERPDGWWEVRDFFGSQAVVYNLPLLDKTPWLQYAYAQLASQQVGPVGPRQIGTCYEHILWHAINACGLKTYCRENHAFTTRDDLVSTRSGQKPAQRNRSIRDPWEGNAPKLHEIETP